MESLTPTKPFTQVINFYLSLYGGGLLTRRRRMKFLISKNGTTLQAGIIRCSVGVHLASNLFYFCTPSRSAQVASYGL